MATYLNTGDLTWGHLEDTAHYGQKMSPEDYVIVAKDDLKSNKYQVKIEASHALLYAKHEEKVFQVYNPRAAILMQMRFDGYLGFPGGLVDPGENDVESLNRELVEELNLDLNKHRIGPGDHVVSHYNQKTGIVTHFYALEVTIDEFFKIEVNSLNAKDHGSEVLGNIRIPLYTMGDGYRGFPLFLKNQFIGNSKEQLLISLKKLNLMSEVEIQRALGAKQ